MHPRSCTGVVLAGGANTRFAGVPKGLLPLGGQRIVDRVLAALGDVVDEVVVVANDPAVRRDLASPSVRVTGDIRPERGSLVGLYSGVSMAPDGALVVAWDMPFVTSALLGELRRIGEAEGVAVIPEGPTGPEPFCAYYPRSQSTTMLRQITAGTLRLGALIDALPSRRILDVTEVARFGVPERLFTNINSPADLERSLRWLREDDGAGTPLPLHSGNTQ